MNKALALSLCPLLLSLLALGCSQAEFASGNARGNASSGQPSTPTPTTPINGCTNSDKVTGAHLLFLMDNSGSMEETDCPGGRATCMGETDREKALLTSFDVLSELHAKYPTQQSAVSTLSYAQFTPGDVFGFASQLVGLEVKGTGRADLQRNVQFLRQPSGDTPFAGAVTKGQELLQAVNGMYPNDGKPRVAVVVTDGEPTDRDPVQVLENVKALRNSGLKWITVRVTNGQELTARTQVHRRLMLNSYENSSRGRNQPNGHWYAPRYASFEAYFAELMLFTGASSDQVIEIDSSDKLQKVILEEIIAKEIQCASSVMSSSR